MPILSDGSIRRRIADRDLLIEPFDDAMVQPASIDFRLGDEFLVFQNHTVDAIDPYNVPADLHRTVRPAPGDPFILHPGEFVLATSAEAIGLPDDLVSRCEGKSSLARLGLLIHVTAGFIDPGWPLGQITLELSNVSQLPIKLWPGMKIGQFSFETLDAPAEKPYGHPDLNSKYVGQSGPVASRYAGNARPKLSVAG